MSALVYMLTTTGLTTPSRRALAFGAAGYAFQMFVQPSVSYLEDGTPRPFSLFSMDGGESEYATYMPWFAWPLAGAVIGSLFL